MQIVENLHAFLWLDPTTNNCNTYFINGQKRILIDPGHVHLSGQMRAHLAALSLGPEDMDLVIVTHGHPDHMEGVQLFSETPALIAFPQIELEFIKNQAPHYGQSMGWSDFAPDFLLREGDLNVGDFRFQVIQTPGHSPGSVCLYWPDQKVLFTGDVVFNQGVGRTDLPGGDGQLLKQSIRTISRLDVDYLLSGHGDPVAGRDHVNANFSAIERMWFSYL